MRFLADMGISPNTVAMLRGLGHIAASGARLPTIVGFRLRNMRPERVNRYLDSILNQHGEALKQRAIISVTEGQIRVRLLPIMATE